MMFINEINLIPSQLQKYITVYKWQHTMKGEEEQEQRKNV